MGNVYFYVHDLRSSGVVRNAITFAERLAQDHDTILAETQLWQVEPRPRLPFARNTLAQKLKRCQGCRPCSS